MEIVGSTNVHAPYSMIQYSVLRTINVGQVSNINMYHIVLFFKTPFSSTQFYRIYNFEVQ